MSFDDRRRTEEEERRRAAEQRAAARSSAGPAPTGTLDSASDGASSLVLHLAAGGLLAGLGVVLAFVWAPLVLLALVGVMVGGRGVVKQLSGAGGGRALTAGTGADARVEAAYSRAREAIEGSSALEEDHRLELLAALRGGYEELGRMEKERPRLMAAVGNLPADGGGEAGARLHQAIDDLDRRRQEFVDQCGRLQATVATLALSGDRPRALSELSEVTAAFGHRVAADDELEQALAARRGRAQDEVGER